ncbi:hypothetical protein [Aromatoleum bremense]|uniref:DUF1145 domain-containing protein n=1 Tax=Aromatoleum bremense TaxID=76115 RepID=A0ABX1NZZ5_9RHOO|nr:hypothetical protein [Aromatoleum bremense]NMG17635.1 hypothetical protein [Aromatoleum bremense]
MLKILIARVIFAIGIFVLGYLAGSGFMPASMTLWVILAYILFCELAVATFIKSRIAPLSVSQKRLALLPWLLPVAAFAYAILVPMH